MSGIARSGADQSPSADAEASTVSTAHHDQSLAGPVTLGANHVRAALDPKATIEVLRTMFQAGCVAPTRHHHDLSAPGAPDGTMLLMPAWMPGRYLGVKLVNVFPANGARDLPAVQGVYLLFCGQTGQLLATIDGNELTARRTAAASALAASYLAAPKARSLLIVGTGRLACYLALAHAAVRPIEKVTIWGRDAAKAERVVAELARSGVAASVAADLAAAVGAADIVSCATLSRDPLIQGSWLRPGCHIDLVGGFTPHMREADDEVIRRGSVFIDTPGALKEAGDIVIPLATGILRGDDIRADLAALACGRHIGRSSPDEITVFKSVGASEEDLAAAILVYERSRPDTTTRMQP